MRLRDVLRTRMVRGPRLVAVMMLIVGLVAGSLGGIAVANSDSTTINGCYNKATGSLRVVTDGSACRQNETAISWNQAGPQGAKGEKGDQGDPGPQGIPGPASLSALQGTDCTIGTTAGTVDVRAAGTGLVSIMCMIPVTIDLQFCAYHHGGGSTGYGICFSLGDFPANDVVTLDGIGWSSGGSAQVTVDETGAAAGFYGTGIPCNPGLYPVRVTWGSGAFSRDFQVNNLGCSAYF